jgi:hypothetical protein
MTPLCYHEVLNCVVQLKQNFTHTALEVLLTNDTSCMGRAIAQAVSRRLGFEPKSGHVGFVVDKVAVGQVFSEYFRFPCQFLFHRLPHIHHHLSSVADNNSSIGGRHTKWTRSHTPHKKKKRKPTFHAHTE